MDLAEDSGSDGNGQQEKDYPFENDLESGSAYEESMSCDDDVQDSPYDADIAPSRSTSTKHQRQRGENSEASRRLVKVGGKLEQSESKAASGPGTPYTDDRICEDASIWAARFEGSLGHDGMRISRRPSTSHTSSRSNKRRAEKFAARNTRAKRLRSFYSNDYRGLLNVDIHDAATGMIGEDQIPLHSSQIGLSIWTSAEKDTLFTGLSRLGRDNVQGIAARIGSKSELEVQEYIHLLHRGMVEKALNEPRQQMLDHTDLPAAVQVSQECCTLLERAADALAFRQDQYEEQVEETKKGEYWLLTSEVSQWVEENRKEEGGEQIIQEVLPSANLLNLKQWLALSQNIFMNPAAPREEDNWQAIADPGETPGIRATAFEDFHSLMVSTTKRLLSTTLFCTMSRLRAVDSRSYKRAEVNLEDVEAAVKILHLNSNSNEFWIGCARRCQLEVFDGNPPLKSRDAIGMTYDEVESALSQGRDSTRQPRSQARVQGEDSPGLGNILDESGSDKDEMEDILTDSEPEDNHDRDSAGAFEYLGNIGLDKTGPIDPSDSEFKAPPSHLERIRMKVKLEKAFERAQNRYTEAFDTQASLMEERRLWALLKQSPPFEIKPESMELPKRPDVQRKEKDELGDWRDYLEYWSQWETLDTPVLCRSFARSSKKRSRTRRAEKATSEEGSEDDTPTSVDLASGEDMAQSYDSDSDEDSGDAGQRYIDEDLVAGNPISLC
jgi:RNA polymerase I-specific transcription initiation factor RRN5